MKNRIGRLLPLVALSLPLAAVAAEPVRYIGTEQADTTHDGGLRWAVGAKSWQAFRANRAHPAQADGFGWTYNHAPMLAHWRGRFWIEYLSAPVHENQGPMHSLLMSSADGITWDSPRVVFPQTKLPDGTPAQMHQRMGFYTAPDGRFLVLGFYGIPTHPNDGRGVGRVVREVQTDGSFGPVSDLLTPARQTGCAWNDGEPA